MTEMENCWRVEGRRSSSWGPVWGRHGSMSEDWTFEIWESHGRRTLGKVTV